MPSLKIPIVLLVGLVLALPSAGQAGLQDAIVKVFTTSRTYDYDSPWQASGVENATGSGCIISGRRILTNAHVVSNATYIEVQRYGDPDKYTATVLAVSHEADLALLQVDKKAFFPEPHRWDWALCQSCGTGWRFMVFQKVARG